MRLPSKPIMRNRASFTASALTISKNRGIIDIVMIGSDYSQKNARHVSKVELHS